MESNILQALPNIHGILIGIGTAFFSGFAMFAYQKLQESKDRLDKILADVEFFSTPSNFIGSGNTSLVTDKGELDWDGEAKSLIHHATSVFSYLDYEEKYGIPRSDFSFSPSEEDILSTAKDLCLMFHYLFVSYPFSGKSMVHIQGVTDKVESRKAEPFSSERLKEIERRISFLSWCWETSNRSLIALGQKATEIERKKTEVEAIKSFHESMASTSDIPEEEKQRIWKRIHQPRLNMQVDYSTIIHDYFNKILIYRERVLPQLLDTLKTYETFNERFEIKAITVNALKVMAFIFIFGVLAPMLISGLKQDIGLEWHVLLPYFLLLITIVPYIYIWTKLFSKVKKLNFS